MPHDFRDGKTFPRRGRKPLGRFLWLARVIDKARATQAGTHFDYIYPCPMDLGMLERWHVTREQFEQALAQHPGDVLESILRAGVIRRQRRGWVLHDSLLPSAWRLSAGNGVALNALPAPQASAPHPTPPCTRCRPR